MDMKEYLDAMGILGCNVNPYLPALDDVGLCWKDMTQALDRHEFFYTKAYRRRVAYLSPQVYYLLKRCRPQKPMTGDAAAICALLEQAGPMETEDLRRLSGLPTPGYVKAFDFLLENLYVTALKNGHFISENWSGLFYCTAAAWEAVVPAPELPGDPEAALRAILGRSLPEAEVARLLRGA